ncbi:Helix-turn-helix domain protein [Paenibacillus larvae subsp. larvae]|uniref:Helix-turn-helix domain protein n=1 Tax=Paenibacillus larvae subsp. larvae TaxID=147375 RepID=A0A6C0QTK2_9BACL|nr:Helix-turn-helix domain protein [Paenibacillus larvae subsp. larvae]
MVNKAYKFRLYPTQEQEQLFAKPSVVSVLVVLNFLSSKVVRQDSPIQLTW